MHGPRLPSLPISDLWSGRIEMVLEFRTNGLRRGALGNLVAAKLGELSFMSILRMNQTTGYVLELAMFGEFLALHISDGYDD